MPVYKCCDSDILLNELADFEQKSDAKLNTYVQNRFSLSSMVSNKDSYQRERRTTQHDSTKSMPGIPCNKVKTHRGSQSLDYPCDLSIRSEEIPRNFESTSYFNDEYLRAANPDENTVRSIPEDISIHDEISKARAIQDDERSYCTYATDISNISDSEKTSTTMSSASTNGRRLFSRIANVYNNVREGLALELEVEA